MSPPHAGRPPREETAIAMDTPESVENHSTQECCDCCGWLVALVAYFDSGAPGGWPHPYWPPPYGEGR